MLLRRRLCPLLLHLILLLPRRLRQLLLLLLPHSTPAMFSKGMMLERGEGVERVCETAFRPVPSVGDTGAVRVGRALRMLRVELEMCCAGAPDGR